MYIDYIYTVISWEYDAIWFNIILYIYIQTLQYNNTLGRKCDTLRTSLMCIYISTLGLVLKQIEIQPLWTLSSDCMTDLISMEVCKNPWPDHREESTHFPVRYGRWAFCLLPWFCSTMGRLVLRYLTWKVHQFDTIDQSKMGDFPLAMLVYGRGS